MAKDVLKHYGMKYRSGRYPYGSGENPFQHDGSLASTIADLKAKGITSEKDLATACGMTVAEFRHNQTIEKQALQAERDAYIMKLADKGYNNVAIAERIGRGESYVRYRRQQATQDREKQLDMTVDSLKDSLKQYKYVDITSGTEMLLGVKKTKMDAAVQKLVNEGYAVEQIKVEQAANPGKFTTVKVIGPAGMTKKDVWNNRDQIGLVTNFYNDDGTRTIRGIKKPVSVDSSRIYVRYAEDGGKQKDGVIELRRNVPDLTMGNSSYAQVRIGVDDTHYLKGMALYSDNIPKGYDIVFNTNKHSSVPKMDVFKEMKTNPSTGEINWDNPFGSSIKMEEGRIVGQKEYTDPKDGQVKLSPVNIVREQGDWDTWSKTLASQFLSKQPKELIDQQLKVSYLKKTNEFDRIKDLTNGEVKRKLLMEFADDCDSSAVHLKAAALPRQSSKVILPLTNIKDTEIYAPTYKNGEKVALIRYPHGGTFEIPILTVNNRNVDGKSVIGPTTEDAVGINSKVAEKLSGADFDGDTVTVIPITNQKIIATETLSGLKDFDAKDKYPYYEGMKVMSKKDTQLQMGKITNLITDMTLQGATEDELARAVKHSMVVIDANKHKLNYKLSEKENNISELKKSYQDKGNGRYGGSSTLISRAKSPVYVPDYKEVIDKETGAIIMEPTEKTKVKWSKDKNGEWHSEVVDRIVKVPTMKITEDARDLMSGPNHLGTPAEIRYADYANKLKALGNDARKEAMLIETSKVNQSAKETYKEEVSSINNKLNIALKNRPYERMAQLIASTELENAKKDNPHMDKDEISKLSAQLLSEARVRTGANKTAAYVRLTDKEWEAIQAGAITATKLRTLMENTDMDRIKKLATPLPSSTLTPSQKSLIRTYAKAGYTLEEIADVVGVSPSTVSKELKN